jgi:uroporphyrin-III C-methyltransferase/precorrin-2 dehydrogenase/sirohydrochlorin ferrochelatase
VDYFPLFADLTDRPCLVVGGGRVASRKVRQLLRAGARITVNASSLDPVLLDMANTGKITATVGEFKPELVIDHLLIVAATSDATVNQAVAAAAAANFRLCNVVDDCEHSSFIVPAIVDREPLTVAISSGGRSPVLTTVIRQKIEGLLPARLGAVARWAEAWRDAVRARFPDLRARRHFWQTELDGAASDLILGGRTAEANRAIVRALAADPARSDRGPGIAYLVGAGPGDPGLITLAGWRLLQQADVVVHDRLVSPALLDLARRDAELITVGKTPSTASISQDEINKLLVQLVEQGNRVCRLKGGDPFVFGRGGEEAEALAAAGMPYQIVPGITAAVGCAAYAGIPLTRRGLAKAVVLITAESATGESEPDWANLAAGEHTLAIYMGVGKLNAVSRQIIAAGRSPDCPTALIENGTTDRQRIVRGTLKELPGLAKKHAVTAPALLLVGQTIALADELAWFTAPPLGTGWPSNSGVAESGKTIWTEPSDLNPGAQT